MRPYSRPLLILDITVSALATLKLKSSMNCNRQATTRSIHKRASSASITAVIGLSTMKSGSCWRLDRREGYSVGLSRSKLRSRIQSMLWLNAGLSRLRLFLPGCISWCCQMKTKWSISSTRRTVFVQSTIMHWRHTVAMRWPSTQPKSTLTSQWSVRMIMSYISMWPWETLFLHSKIMRDISSSTSRHTQKEAQRTPQPVTWPFQTELIWLILPKLPHSK